MYEIILTTRFKKDFKLIKKRQYKIEKIELLFNFLQDTGTVPLEYKPHKLIGNYVDNLECHIENDWLLIWITDETDKTVTLVRTGTHYDLF